MLALLMDFALQSPEVIRFLLSLLIGFLACLAMAYLLGKAHAEAQLRRRMAAAAGYPKLPTRPGYNEWRRRFDEHLKLYRSVEAAARYADKALEELTKRYEAQEAPRP